MEINSHMLKACERFLRGTREITRPNQGKMITKQSAGLKDKGVHNLMRDLRTLFNEAKKKYNNEELGIIKVPHSPFQKYQVPKKPATKKRNQEHYLFTVTQ